MKTSRLVTVTGTAGALAILAACATDGETPIALADDASAPLPAPAIDGGGDAPTSKDGSSSVDASEYYPDECTDDALCQVPLFGEVATPETLDVRTHVQRIAARSPTDA